MEYIWDYKKIKLLKQQYLYLLKKTEGLTKTDKQNIKVKLNNIKDLQKTLNPSPITNFTLPNLKKNNLAHTINSYREIPKIFRQHILNTIHPLQNFEDTYNDIELPKISLTNQELIDMTHDFFAWLPNKNYLKLIKHYTNPKTRILHFQTNPLYTNVSGITFPFYYPYYIPYFLINLENTIQDFCTLNHELSHGIYYANEASFSKNNNHSYLRELEGYFFSFLSITYLKEKRIVSSKVLKDLEYNELISALDNFISFYITYLRIYLHSHKKEINIENIYQLVLEHELNNMINEATIYSYFNEDPKENAKYFLSYLINIDLKEIFKKDAEYGFYIFESIRKNTSNDITKMLKNNKITFMEDNYTNLTRQLNELKLTKK